MLELIFAAALSAAPLTLYIPPVRRLNLFIEKMELFVRENSRLYTTRAVPLLRFGFRRIMAALLQALSDHYHTTFKLPAMVVACLLDLVMARVG